MSNERLLIAKENFDKRMLILKKQSDKLISEIGELQQEEKNFFKLLGIENVRICETCEGKGYNLYSIGYNYLSCEKELESRKCIKCDNGIIVKEISIDRR